MEEKIVKVIEEVSPETGYTEKEIKNNLWNSPPTRKGLGRYRLNGKSIESNDFVKLKAQKLI